MATQVKDILAKNYTPAIKNHPAFKSLKTISKVFPEIGLPNCEEEIVIDNSKEKQAAAKQLLTAIKTLATDRNRKMTEFAKNKDKKFKADRQAKYDNVRSVINTLNANIRHKAKDFIVENNGKLTLNLPEEIKDASNKVVFKKGERLLSVYNKVNDMLKDGKFAQMHNIDTVPQFKDFSSKNVPSNNSRVVFSSDGPDGIWDVATMSMRGITSCQTWGGGNATHVVGSMIDPFTGIIYTTNGTKTEYGTKMIRRCIVRFVVNEKTKKAHLHLERMYPAHDGPTMEMFQNFLAKKTDGKFEVKTSIAGCYVPMSDAVRKLAPADQPYRDSGITYKNDVNDKRAKVKEMMDAKMLRLYSIVTNAFRNATNSIKGTDVPKDSLTSFRAMKGNNYYYDYSYYYYDAIVSMTKSFINEMDTAKYKNADVLLKDTVEAMSNAKLKTKISGAIRAAIKSNNIPAGYKTLAPKLIGNISDAAEEQIVKSLKEEITRISAKIKPEDLNQNVDEDLEDVPTYVKFLN